MVKAEFTCSCYEPPFREKVTVKANSFNEAWDKAIKKAARKYKAKAKDVSITSSYWENIDS
jgi:hypothetical protein